MRRVRGGGGGGLKTIDASGGFFLCRFCVYRGLLCGRGGVKRMGCGFGNGGCEKKKVDLK